MDEAEWQTRKQRMIHWKMKRLELLVTLFLSLCGERQ